MSYVSMRTDQRKNFLIKIVQPDGNLFQWTLVQRDADGFEQYVYGRNFSDLAHMCRHEGVELIYGDALTTISDPKPPVIVLGGYKNVSANIDEITLFMKEIEKHQ